MDDKLYRALGTAVALGMREDDRKTVLAAALQRNGWLYADEPDEHQLLDGLAHLAAVYIKSFAESGGSIEIWAEPIFSRTASAVAEAIDREG